MCVVLLLMCLLYNIAIDRILDVMFGRVIGIVLGSGICLVLGIVLGR